MANIVILDVCSAIDDVLGVADSIIGVIIGGAIGTSVDVGLVSIAISNILLNTSPVVLVKSGVANLALILIHDVCLAVRDTSLRATRSIAAQKEPRITLRANIRIGLDRLTICNVNLSTSISREEES